MALKHTPQGPRARDHKGIILPSYFKNLSQSMVAYAADEFKEIVPVVGKYKEVNKGYTFAEFKSEIKKGLKGLKSMVTSDEAVLETVKQNLKEDLRSGTFYNKARIEKNKAKGLNFEGFEDEEAGGGLDDINFEGDDWGIDEETPKSSKKGVVSSRQVINNFVTGVSPSAQMESTKILGETILKSTSAQISNQSRLLNAMNYQNSVYHRNSLNLLSVMNSNISNVITGINALGELANSTQTYQENSLKIQEDILAIQRENLDIVKSIYMKEDSDKNASFNQDDIIDSDGTINIRNYMKTLNREKFYNALDKMLPGLGTALQLPDMLKDMGFGTLGNSKIVNSPLMLPVSFLFGKVIGPGIRKSLQGFSKDLQNAGAALLLKLNQGIGKKLFSGEGLLSKTMRSIVDGLGTFFGIDIAGRSQAYGRLAKEATPFDTYTRKAIIHVIPTLLSKIYSAVSGAPELAVDYARGGRLVTKEAVKARYEAEKEEAASGAFWEQDNDIREKLEASDLTENQKMAVMENVNKLFMHMAKTGTIYDPDNAEAGLVFQTLEGVSDNMLETINTLFRSMSDELKLSMGKSVIQATQALNNTIREMEEGSQDSLYGQLFMDMNYDANKLLGSKDKIFESNKERDKVLGEFKKDPKAFYETYGEKYGISSPLMGHIWASKVQRTNYDFKKLQLANDVFGSYSGLIGAGKETPKLDVLSSAPTAPGAQPAETLASKVGLVDQNVLRAGIKAYDEEQAAWENRDEPENKTYSENIFGRASKAIDEANSTVGKILTRATAMVHNSLMWLLYDDPKYKDGMDPEGNKVAVKNKGSIFDRMKNFFRNNIVDPIKERVIGPVRKYFTEILIPNAKKYFKATKEVVGERFNVLRGVFKDALFGKDGKPGIVDTRPIREYFSSLFKSAKAKGKSVFDSIKTGFKDALLGDGKSKKGLIDITPLKEFGSNLKKFLLGDKKEKKAIGDKFRNFLRSEKAGQMAIGSAIGIVSSLFLPGGPILGGIMGAVSPLVFNFKKIKETLFGPDSAFKNALDKIRNVLSDETNKTHIANALSGGLVGGIAGWFFGHPTLGALGGTAVGAMVSLIRNATSLREKLFGSETNDTGVFSRWLVTRAKRFLPTIGMGALGATLGPFGIWGGLAMGILAETTSFKRFLWGSRDKKGKKQQLGLFDMVGMYFRKNLTLPFKSFMSGFGAKLSHQLRRDIAAPFKHLGRTINLVFKSQLDRMANWFKGTKFYGILERMMHSVVGAASKILGFARAGITKALSPITGLLTKGLGWAAKGIAGLLSFGISDKYKQEYEESKAMMKGEQAASDKQYKKDSALAKRQKKEYEREAKSIDKQLEADRKRKKRGFKNIAKGMDPNEALGEPDTPVLAEMRAGTTVQQETNEEVRKQTNIITQFYEAFKQFISDVKEKANSLVDEKPVPKDSGEGRGLFKGYLPDDSFGRGNLLTSIGSFAMGGLKSFAGNIATGVKNKVSRGAKAIKDFFFEGGITNFAKNSLRNLLNVGTLGQYKKITNAWRKFNEDEDRGISANEQTAVDPMAILLEKMDVVIKHLGLLTNLDPMLEYEKVTAKKTNDVANNTNDLEEGVMELNNAVGTLTTVTAMSGATGGAGGLLSSAGGLLGKAGGLLGKGGLLAKGASLLGKGGLLAKGAGLLTGLGSTIAAGFASPIAGPLLAAVAGGYAVKKGYDWYKSRKAAKEKNLTEGISKGMSSSDMVKMYNTNYEEKQKASRPFFEQLKDMSLADLAERIHGSGGRGFGPEEKSAGKGPLSQLDPAIAGMDYSASGEKDTVGLAGCSPVSLYNAMSNIGKGLNPIDIIEESKQFKVKGSGTEHSGLAQVARNHGYNINASTSNFGSKIDQNLASGGQSLVIGTGNEISSPFTPAGHTVNIAGEAGENYIVANPLHSGYEVWDKSAIDDNALKVLNVSSSGRGEAPTAEEKKAENDDTRTVDKAPLLERLRKLFKIAGNLREDNIGGIHPLLLQKLVAYGEHFKEKYGGKQPLITSAYRTMADQRRISGKAKKGMAAKPGTSKHEFGLAVDINSRDVDASILRTLGLSRPLLNLKAGAEPWHVEPTEWAGQRLAQAKQTATSLGGLTVQSPSYNADMANNVESASTFSVMGSTGQMDYTGALQGLGMSMSSGFVDILRQAFESIMEVISGITNTFKGSSDSGGKNYDAGSRNLKAGVVQNGKAATGDRKQFIQSITSGALKGYRDGKILPSLTVGQAILESGWGKRSIGNNVFGIKASKGWTGGTENVVTHEYDKSGRKYQTTAAFRTYPSIEEGIIDHTKFLQGPRYQKAGLHEAKEFYEATSRVHKAGYATDPKYPETLNKIISGRKIQVLDKAALDENYSISYDEALKKYGDSIGFGRGKMNVGRMPTAFESIKPEFKTVESTASNNALNEALIKHVDESTRSIRESNQTANAIATNGTANNAEIVKLLSMILEAIVNKELKVEVPAADTDSSNGYPNGPANRGRINKGRPFSSSNPVDRGYAPFSPIDSGYISEIQAIASGR